MKTSGSLVELDKLGKIGQIRLKYVFQGASINHVATYINLTSPNKYACIKPFL